jgi:hypothetical protein
MPSYNTISRLINFKNLPPTIGLVAAWNLSTVNDSFGANNLTNNNAATFTAGKIDNAVTLNGTTQYLSIADNANISYGAGKKFTVCGWFKLAAIAAETPIVAKWSGAGNREYMVAALSANNSLGFFVSSNGTAISSVGTAANRIFTGVWYFFAAWYDGNNLYIELNADTIVSILPYSSDIFNGNSELNIGRKQEGPVFFGGQIDAVRLYKHDNRVLTANERSVLYHMGMGREFVTAPNVVTSEEVNLELDQIINLFNGNSLDITPKIHVDLTDPALIVNQNGNGSIFQAYTIGSLKFEVNNQGQIVSHLPTGTPPFVNAAASSGLVNNLNVQFLDGLLSNEILQPTSLMQLESSVFFPDTVIVGDSKPLVALGDKVQYLFARQTNSMPNSTADLRFKLSLLDDTFNNNLATISLPISNPLVPIYIGDLDINCSSNKRFKLTCTVKNGAANFTDVTVGIISKQVPF